MKKKAIRVGIVVSISIIIFFLINHSGLQKLFLHTEKMDLNTLDIQNYKENETALLRVHNLQAYFYGDTKGAEKFVYVVMELQGYFLVVELDYDLYYEAVQFWSAENHYFNKQVEINSLGSFEGKLTSMEEALKLFILETQGIYLGEELEEKLIPYVFKGGKVTDDRAEVTIINFFVLGVSVLGVIACFVLPLKKSISDETASIIES